MNAINYIGNCRNLIDCDSLLEELKSKEGVSRTIETPYGRGSDLTQNVDALCMYNAWKDAGYIDANCVEWINFYPETEFSSNYIDLLSKFLGIIPKNVWISSIKPGKCVPWHWDIEQNADEWSKEGSLTRYTVFIDTPKLGHVFVADNQCFYLIEQGSMYKWKNWKDWHLGFNCGFEQKYMLHIVGVE